MASGEAGAPGACAIAVTDSRIELAAAVVTPVATRRRTKSRREMPLVRSCATRFLIDVLLCRLRRRGRVGPRLSQEIGHGSDLVLGPERPAPDHPVEDAFPRFALLPQRAPHARLVALEALALEDFLAGAPLPAPSAPPGRPRGRPRASSTIRGKRPERRRAQQCESCRETTTR